jgi:competence protein ComEA
MNWIGNRTAALIIGALLGFPLGLSAAADTQKKQTADAKKDTSRGERLDLNTASLGELKAIRGMSESQAKKIVEGRPYKRRNDLLTKKIVDAETYGKIKDRVYTKRTDG